ncbi:hypothetical protein BS47DRAFT_1426614 [Hydnum rufescens UP504]|uniref:Uncharacterized protein n=1 Tax=Hydnum rufescens UP504 TaxID=1448309 RepID=A0A9P6E2Q6_9AGAM|nr:hypothetical protein BS47DRAFT_1426614 [Hydnum rufescens UP504]
MDAEDLDLLSTESSEGFYIAEDVCQKEAYTYHGMPPKEENTEEETEGETKGKHCSDLWSANAKERHELVNSERFIQNWVLEALENPTFLPHFHLAEEVEWHSCNEVPPGFRRTLVVVLGQSRVDRLGAGWEGIRGEEGERVITPPLALALGGGAAHRAKHWLFPEHRRKGCKGMGMMVKRYDVVTGKVAQSLPKERRAVSGGQGGIPLPVAIEPKLPEMGWFAETCIKWAFGSSEEVGLAAEAENKARESDSHNQAKGEHLVRLNWGGIWYILRTAVLSQQQHLKFQWACLSPWKYMKYSRHTSTEPCKTQHPTSKAKVSNVGRSDPKSKVKSNPKFQVQVLDQNPKVKVGEVGESDPKLKVKVREVGESDPKLKFKVRKIKIKVREGGVSDPKSKFKVGESEFNNF